MTLARTINRIWYSPLALSFFLMDTPVAWAAKHHRSADTVASSGGGGSGLSFFDQIAEYFNTIPKEWIVIGIVLGVVIAVVVALKGTDCNCRCGLQCKCKCRCGSTCQCMAKQINHF